MCRLREHVDGLYEAHLVAGVLQRNEVTGERGRLAGDVDDLLRVEGNDLL